MMGRHRLLTVSWREYTAPKEQPDEVDAGLRMSPGWKYVDEIKRVFEKIRAIENDLVSSELHGGDYEDFAKQEDKIMVRENSLFHLQNSSSLLSTLFVCCRKLVLILILFVLKWTLSLTAARLKSRTARVKKPRRLSKH